MRGESEKVSGTACPASSFFLGDPFQRAYVRARLRQDVMKVVADADETEPFLEELADARGTEEEQPEYHVVLLGMLDQLVGRGEQFLRCVHFREDVGFKKAHRHAEVVLAKEEDVDTE